MSNLWIRSQDREILCKADCVDMMHLGGGNANIFLNCTFPDLIVGTYTKERALEVLDEIQNYLTPRFIITTTSDNVCIEDLFDKLTACKVFPDNKLEIKNIARDCWVYQMPKE